MGLKEPSVSNNIGEVSVKIIIMKTKNLITAVAVSAGLVLGVAAPAGAKERAEAAGGTLEVNSGPGKGFVLAVEVPFEA